LEVFVVRFSSQCLNRNCGEKSLGGIGIAADTGGMDHDDPEASRVGAIPSAILLVLSCVIPASGQSAFQGEEVLRSLDPSAAPWEISFEKDAKGFRPIPRAVLRRTPEGPVSVRLSGDAAATAIAAVPGHYNLARYEEVHLWVQADAELRLQPFSQTSGWVFRDGGARAHLNADSLDH